MSPVSLLHDRKSVGAIFSFRITNVRGEGRGGEGRVVGKPDSVSVVPGGGGTRDIPGWGGAARPLIP